MIVLPHYEFGAYRLDEQDRMLFREGEHVPLSPRAVALLLALVQAAGRVLTREQLLQQLWANTVVEEGSLTSHISVLRKTLAAGAPGREFVETVPKRGYRFVAPVKCGGSEASESGVHRDMLVVLPFENLTTGDKYDYFSDGLTKEMITELARLSPACLGVIARTTAMQFKSTAISVAQIGGELGVSHVLEGSVRRAEERVRITAQLIRVSDESHLWAESYERGLHDVLAVQAEVARAVAREVRITLTPTEQLRLDRGTGRAVNPQAHELYLRGRHFWYRRTEETMRKSIECFEEALRLDPGLAAAHDGICDAHTMLACRGMALLSNRFTRPRRRPGKPYGWILSSVKVTRRSHMCACTTGTGWTWRADSGGRWS